MIENTTSVQDVLRRDIDYLRVQLSEIHNQLHVGGEPGFDRPVRARLETLEAFVAKATDVHVIEEVQYYRRSIRTWGTIITTAIALASVIVTYQVSKGDKDHIPQPGLGDKLLIIESKNDVLMQKMQQIEQLLKHIRPTSTQE